MNMNEKKLVFELISTCFSGSMIFTSSVVTLSLVAIHVANAETTSEISFFFTISLGAFSTLCLIIWLYTLVKAGNLAKKFLSINNESSPQATSQTPPFQNR